MILQKKASKKIPGSYRLVHFVLVVWNIMNQVFLETVSRHIKKKGVGSNQQFFWKAVFVDQSFCLLCDEVIESVNRGKAENVTCLSKAFDAIAIVLQ